MSELYTHIITKKGIASIAAVSTTGGSRVLWETLVFNSSAILLYGSFKLLQEIQQKNHQQKVTLNVFISYVLITSYTA